MHTNYKKYSDVRRHRDWNVFAAAAHGRVDILEKLWTKGVDFNARQNYETPLYHALMHHQLKSARFLLEHGARVNENATEHCSHLYKAVEFRSEEALDLLFQYGANGACFDSGKAVELAVRNRDLGILRKLLMHGARKDEGLWIALHAVDWEIIGIFTSICSPLDRSWFNEWCLRHMTHSKNTIDVAHHIVEHSGDLSGLPECMQRLAVCLQTSNPDWVKHRESLWWLVRHAIERGAHHWETVAPECWFQFFWSNHRVRLIDIAKKQNCQHMIEFLSYR